MKKIYAVFAGILLSAAVAMPAVYVQGAETPTQKALSPEDMEKLHKDLAGLAKVLGLKVTKSESETKTKVAPEKTKTMADVLDKALDISTTYVASVAQTLQKVAPELWRIMIRQQYANAVSYLVVPWGLVILGIILYTLLARLVHVPEDEVEPDYDSMNMAAFKIIARIVLFIATSLCAAVGVFQSVYAVKILINPEYYAIKDLLAVLLGRGGL